MSHCGAHGPPVLDLVGAVNRPETESAAQTHFLVSLEFSNRLGNVFLGNPERPSLVRMTVVQVDIEECLCSSHQCKNFFFKKRLFKCPQIHQVGQNGAHGALAHNLVGEVKNTQ